MKLSYKMTSSLFMCNENTPQWSLKGRIVPAKCISLYDGDTGKFAFKAHDNLPEFIFNCRLNGVNCAEIRTKDENEKKKAIEARDYLRALIEGQIVILHLGNFDKYGRVLIDIYTQKDLYVNNDLIEKGYGKCYDGKGKKDY